VSNPVAPPPPTNDGSYPPPANQGFGAAPAGQPGPGQPAPGQPAPGQPYGDQAQQGFGAAPAAFPAEKKGMNPVLKIVLRIGLALVVGIVFFVVKDALFGDKAKNAAVGDCIEAPKDVKVGKETDADAKVVDCTSTKAAYTVVGRVEGETSTSSPSCDKFFKEDEQFAVYASDAAGGYLLCLKPKA
jgi:hypothetical protein